MVVEGHVDRVVDILPDQRDAFGRGVFCMSNAPAVRDQELAAARCDPKAILLDILRDIRVSLEQSERTYFAAVVSLDLFDQSSNHGVLAWIG